MKRLKHIISTDQFQNAKNLEKIFQLADAMEANDQLGCVPQTLAGKILAAIFYEPSTRTRFSFEAAMAKLGGNVLTTESATHFSSVTKGETLEDTIRIIGAYADVIVLRHPQTGSAAVAAKVSTVPIVNAGDGAGEHPTQALLDMYTIRKELGRLEKLHIGLVGDLFYGRTIHSLLRFFHLYKGIKISLVAPEQLKLPQKYLDLLKKQRIPVHQTDKLESVVGKVDVLYVTRVQKERFASIEEYEKVKNAYVIDRAILKKMKTKSIIMHPLPRVTEIDPAIDRDPRAAYFRQARNGLYVRMALLDMILNHPAW